MSKNITNNRYGRLIALKVKERKDYKDHWLCICDCGNTTVVNYFKLLSGHTKSCGCLQKEKTKTHGKTKTPLYKRWTAMLSRCNYSKNKYYSNYGGRGIQVLWNSFEDFYKDMVDTFSPELEIDRIDNNGHYCKENCRWVSRNEQSLNKRSNHLIKFNGRIQTIVEWAREYNMTSGALTSRLRRGWFIEDALKRKPRERGFPKMGFMPSPEAFSGTVSRKQG